MQLSREKVIRYRERLGYSQAMLRAESGLAEHTIVRAENCREVVPSTARRLAAALGVTVADLVREPDE